MTDFELKYSINPEINFQKLKEQLNSLKTLLTGVKGENIIDDKETVNNIKNIEKEISKLDKEIDNAAKSSKKIDDGLKETQKTAGGLKDAFVGAFAGFTAANAVTAGLGMLKQGFTDSLEAAKGFTSGLAELQAVTGVSGKGLDAMGESARALALKFGTDVNEQLKSFSGILSVFGPDLAKTPAALNSMTDTLNTLAKAGLMTADEAMKALNGTMLQFGIDAKDPTRAAEEYTRIANIMSAAAAVGSASIQETSESMKVAGGAAHLAGMSIEETAAAIQTMALAELKGSEAGTGLRNVLGYLQKNSAEADKALAKIGLSTEELGKSLNSVGLGKTMEMFGEALKSIQDPAERNALLMQVFGTETAGAANALIANSQAMKDYQKGLTGTNDATRQANVIMDSYAEKQKRAEAAVGDLKLSIGEKLLPIITKFSEILGWMAKNLDVLAPALIALGVAAGVALAPSLASAAVASWAFTASLLANPVVLITAGIALLVTGIIIAVKNIDTIKAKIIELGDEAMVFLGLMKESQTTAKFVTDGQSQQYGQLALNVAKFNKISKQLTKEEYDSKVKKFREFIAESEKTNKITTEQAKKLYADLEKAKNDAKGQAQPDDKKDPKKPEDDKDAKKKAKEALDAKKKALDEYNAYFDRYTAQLEATRNEDLADEKAYNEYKNKQNQDALERSQKENLEILAEITKETEAENKKKGMSWDDYIRAIAPALNDLENSFSDFSQNLVEGNADAGKALRDLAFKQLENLIPIFVAEIFGQSISQLGPIAGAVATGLLTGALYGLVGLAKSKLGADAGVIDIDGNYRVAPSRRDTIPVYLRLGESVITPEGTWAEGNKEMLEFMNSGHSFMEFPGLKQMLNQNNVSTTTTVNDNTEILNKMNNNLLLVNESINQISGRVHILDREIYSANKRYDKSVKNRRIY